MMLCDWQIFWHYHFASPPIATEYDEAVFEVTWQFYAFREELIRRLIFRNLITLLKTLHQLASAQA